MHDDEAALSTLIRGRRTTKLLDPDRQVTPEVIAELCALATWAPNHRRTDPWRFAVFTGDGRARLGATIADELAAAGAHEAKILKTRTKYLRAPVVIVVGSIAGPDPVTTGENRDAVAAGINNLLLGAHARGLATLWSSVATPTSPALWELCGFPEGTFAVGAVYLGHPTGEEPPGRRAEPVITWIDGD
ncbi:MAG: nitroreductase [Acidimicrobiales bacterium]